MDGFSPEAQRFLEWMSQNGVSLQALLQYGFRFLRSEVQLEYLHEDVREVADRVTKDVLHSGDPMTAVVQGVDDAWEASLLCFMLEMIQQSHDINFFDLKRRGLI